MQKSKKGQLDIKVTKKRLSGLLFYDWLILVGIIIAIILVWELIFSLTSVRITVGQTFHYYYDVGVSGNGNDKLVKLLNDKQSISFNVVEINHATVTSDSDTLNLKLQVQEGDIVFTNSQDKEGQTNRAEWLASATYAYNISELITDAKNYLQLFKDDNGNISDAKVSSIFLSRIEGALSNYFRTDEQRQKGVKLEKERVERLVKDTADLEYLFENHADIFYSYKDTYYGIKMEMLTDGKTNVTEYVSLSGTGKAEGVVMMPLNFLSYQPHEQFEVISFMMTIVRDCSALIQQ